MEEFNGFYILSLAVPLILGVGIYLLFLFRHKLNHKNKLFIFNWNVLLLSFFISIIFFGGETYYRFYVDTTDSFALNLITKRWGKRHYQSNNAHFRDNIDYDKQNLSNKKRVTFIGDSFTAGYGVKDVDNRFANIIRSQNPELDIHVMANNGFETDNHIDILNEVFEGSYSTDVIVLVYNLNDISYLTSETKKIYDRIYGWENELNYFGKNSYLINTWFFRLKALRDPDIKNYYDFLASTYESEIWETQKDNLSYLYNKVKKQKVKLIVVTFPFLTNLSDDYKFQGAHVNIKQFWDSKGVPNIDLTEVFKNHKEENLTVNAYDAHPNENGHIIAAEPIANFIKDNL